MERAEHDAHLEAAIVTAMTERGMVTDDHLLTGFVIVAAYQRPDSGQTLTYWVPELQPTHHTVGMLTLVDQFVRDADFAG